MSGSSEVAGVHKKAVLDFTPDGLTGCYTAVGPQDLAVAVVVVIAVHG